MSLATTILNAIRDNADTEYQERVPEATKTNINEIGRILDTYEPLYNQFVTNLIHKIGRTYVETALFQNKLKRFKSGEISSQQDIEEIFVEAFRKAEGAYDKDGGIGEGKTNHPLKRREYQDVQVYYHRMNRQDYYAITVERVDVIRAFRSENALNQFLTAQLNSMTTGIEYDEWLHMKKLLGEAIANGDFYDYQVTAITDSLTDTQLQRACKDFVRTMKKAIADVSYVSRLYNPAGVKTKTEKKDLVLFINKDIPPHLDVDMYSSIFGPGYADLNIEIVELDNFGEDNTGTYALLCDREWFKVFDTLNVMKTQENAVGLYTTFFHHIWQILSYSKFKTAIRFGTTLNEKAKARIEALTGEGA